MGRCGSRRFLLLALPLFAGCVVGPDYRPPAAPLPTEWSQADTAPSARTADLTRWWIGFQDPLLDDLIQRAIADNLDVALARARLREARASARASSASLWPSVSGTAAITRGRQASTALPTGTPQQAVADTYDLYQTGLDAAWELDVFGAVRRATEAANANLQATAEDGRATLVSLTAEVVINYVELRSAQAQLRVATETLASQEDTLALVRSRFSSGLASARDVAQAASAAADTRATLPAPSVAVRQAIHRISVLLGSAPNALAQELEPARPIPTMNEDPKLGVPADLLRRRPDVRAAERRVMEATAQIGVAEANRYPSFTLIGTVGFISMRAEDFGTGDSRTWSFGPSLNVPIFSAGRLAAEVDVQRARWEQAETRYRSTVLTAATEVEDTIAAYNSEKRRYNALSGVIAAHQESLTLSKDLHSSGLSDFLDVLDAERTLLAAQDQQIQSTAQLAVHAAKLCKALGGGWSAAQ